MEVATCFHVDANTTGGYATNYTAALKRDVNGGAGNVVVRIDSEIRGQFRRSCCCRSAQSYLAHSSFRRYVMLWSLHKRIVK